MVVVGSGPDLAEQVKPLFVRQFAVGLARFGQPDAVSVNAMFRPSAVASRVRFQKAPKKAPKFSRLSANASNRKRSMQPQN